LVRIRSLIFQFILTICFIIFFLAFAYLFSSYFFSEDTKGLHYRMQPKVDLLKLLQRFLVRCAILFS